MTCSRELLEAYFDRELDASNNAAIERHLGECALCTEALVGLERQRTEIRESAPYYHASPELKRAIANRLSTLQAAKTGQPEYQWRWAAIAASLLLAVSVGWNLYRVGPRAAESEFAQAVVADHIRSLIGTHLVDVPSSDRHTVKPWFAGKLDFSPEVKDLASDGFPLAGGRVDYLGGRTVAALIYRRGQHVINLFEWPQSSSQTAGSFNQNGYHALNWTAAGMTYWAVSDVAAPELERFRGLIP